MKTWHFSFSLLLAFSVVAQAETPVERSRGIQPGPRAKLVPRGNSNGPQTQGIATPSPETYRTGFPGLGAQIFATGSNDVIVSIMPPHRVAGSDNIHDGMKHNIYLCTTESSRRLIGTVDAITTQPITVNLGKLPAGEVILAIGEIMYWEGVPKAVPGALLKTGPADRNPDSKPHAMINPLPGGLTEVMFEDTYNTPLELKRHYFTDAILRVKGVKIGEPPETADTLASLQKIADDPSQPAKVRAAAQYAVKNSGLAEGTTR